MQHPNPTWWFICCASILGILVLSAPSWRERDLQHHHIPHIQHVLKPRVMCMDLPDLTAWCEYSAYGFCMNTMSHALVQSDDPSQWGQPLPGLNELSDNFMHLDRPDASSAHDGLPYRSFLQGAYASPQENAQKTPGLTVIAALDDDWRGGNLFHFSTTMMVAWLAKLHPLQFDGKIDNVLILKPRVQFTDFQAGLCSVIFGSNTSFMFLEELQQATPDGICFERALVLGASLTLFSGTWDSMRFRRALALAYPDPMYHLRKEMVTLFRRTEKRVIENLEDIAIESERATGLKSQIVQFSGTTPFHDQLQVMSGTALFITAHGATIPLAMFMPASSAVVEICGYKFNYILYERAVLSMGHFHFRYTASRSEIVSVDTTPFVALGSAACFADAACMETVKDASMNINLERFRSYLDAASDASSAHVL